MFYAQEAEIMEIHEFYIPSSSGLANLHCMEWIPNGEVKAVVQIAHGMMEHVEDTGSLRNSLRDTGSMFSGMTT